MISQEEYELILSFKNQMDEKVKIFNENQIEIEKQEKIMRDLSKEIVENQIIVEEYKNTVSFLKKSVEAYTETLVSLKDQLKKDREQILAEDMANNNKILKDSRISASYPCILLCTEILDQKKTSN